MTTRVLEIKVNTTGDAEKGLKGIAGALGTVGTVAGTVALGGLAALGAGLVSSTQAAMEAQDGQAELQAVLESTGGKAGVTAEMVNQLASAFQAQTKFSDDAILSGQNMLLTFTNIGSEVFPMATEAMLNMAEKFGSMDQASVQLGKALNDPIAGVTALRRVGVQLTEEQEQSIQKFMELGDVASAQKVILNELETEFGGLAVAAGNTTSGMIARLTNKFGDLQEKVGAGVIPILEAIFPVIDEFLTQLEVVGEQALPVINDALTRMANALGMASGEVTATDVLVKALKMTFDAIIIAVQLVAVTMHLAANQIQALRSAADETRNNFNRLRDTFNSVMSSIRSGIQSAIDKWNDFKRAVRSAVDAIPDWLIPGSPTAFEIGLRGIANASGQVANTLPQAFSMGNGIGASMVSANGNTPIQFIIEYRPLISTGDQFELEKNLMPLLEDAYRKFIGRG